MGKSDVEPLTPPYTPRLVQYGLSYSLSPTPRSSPPQDGVQYEC